MILESKKGHGPIQIVHENNGINRFHQRVLTVLQQGGISRLTVHNGCYAIIGLGIRRQSDASHDGRNNVGKAATDKSGNQTGFADSLCELKDERLSKLYNQQRTIVRTFYNLFRVIVYIHLFWVTLWMEPPTNSVSIACFRWLWW